MRDHLKILALVLFCFWGGVLSQHVGAVWTVVVAFLVVYIGAKACARIAKL